MGETATLSKLRKLIRQSETTSDGWVSTKEVAEHFGVDRDEAKALLMQFQVKGELEWRYALRPAIGPDRKVLVYRVVKSAAVRGISGSGTAHGRVRRMRARSRQALRKRASR